MDAKTLNDAIVAAGCPIVGVSVGKGDDRATWKFTPAAGVTQPQIDAGNNVIATIPINSKTDRDALFLADANTSDLADRIKGATPAQIDAWLLANVTTLAQARGVLGTVIKYLARNS